MFNTCWNFWKIYKLKLNWGYVQHLLKFVKNLHITAKVVVIWVLMYLPMQTKVFHHEQVAQDYGTSWRHKIILSMKVIQEAIKGRQTCKHSRKKEVVFIKRCVGHMKSLHCLKNKEVQSVKNKRKRHQNYDSAASLAGWGWILEDY